MNNKDFKNFAIDKIKEQRKVSWNEVSMLYHVVTKVLLLFIIYMFTYMVYIYHRIQIYESNLADDVEYELKKMARQVGNDIL